MTLLFGRSACAKRSAFFLASALICIFGLGAGGGEIVTLPRYQVEAGGELRVRSQPTTNDHVEMRTYYVRQGDDILSRRLVPVDEPNSKGFPATEQLIDRHQENYYGYPRQGQGWGRGQGHGSQNACRAVINNNFEEALEHQFYGKNGSPPNQGPATLAPARAIPSKPTDISDLFDPPEAPDRPSHTGETHAPSHHLSGHPPIPIAQQDLHNIAKAAQIAVNERQNTFVDSAAKIMELNRRDAEFDQQVLSDRYMEMPVRSLGEHFERAQKNLNDMISDLQQARQGMDTAERRRFTNVFLNARDKASLGLSTIQDELNRQATLGKLSPFQGLLGNKEINPLAKTPGLQDIFGPPRPRPEATTPDALSDRALMLNGLPDQQRAAVMGQLKLLDQPVLVMPNGETKALALPHNGYIFGGSSTGVDCSSFVSEALPAELRKTRFTTLDFRTIWIYRRSGKFPKPPVYTKERGDVVRRTADAFTPLDVYAGDTLMTGDLLVYRVPWETAGHIFIIRSYNPELLQARVLEASQSAGTIRERTFDLSIDPMDRQDRLLRPGLFGLRLKTESNSACRYKDPHELPKKAISPQEEGGSQ